ncbi:MAG: hypothetical protein HC927_00310 [Deltaproteobacteria bacterium]|nr:hypothetical protein [Deltaproteobacteria bacterium]
MARTEWILALSRGIRERSTDFRYDMFGTQNVPVPPIEEQAAIVKFLDHADRRIRRYIRAKQRLINLLEEQKQAIIDQAVTRGLDPKVPLKKSGVPWLGQIPAHWEIARFKSRIGFQEGPGIMASDFRDNGVPLLRIAGLHGEVASLEGCNFLEPAMVEKRWSHFRVQSGDYLLSSSASTGKVVLATDAVAGSIPYTGIIRLWPQSSDVFMPFVSLYLGSRPFQGQIDAAKSGVGIEHFGPTHLKRMVIAMPPFDEQREIYEYVRRALNLVAPIADNARSEIDLLKECRTRLIADIVTGQFDVREAATNLPDLPPDTSDLDNADPDEDDDTTGANPEEN